MNSIEIAVLEFWHRDEILRGWQRDPGMERPLVDADWDKPKTASSAAPVFLRIQGSERKEDWATARKSGNFAEMVAILRSFGCERAAEVAHMLDIERRERAFVAEIGALRRERVGGA